MQASDPFRGAVFGEMVHEVFESIDFAAPCGGRAMGRISSQKSRG